MQNAESLAVAPLYERRSHWNEKTAGARPRRGRPRPALQKRFFINLW